MCEKKKNIYVFFIKECEDFTNNDEIIENNKESRLKKNSEKEE